MEFLKKAFTWIADLSSKLPKADFKIFFIAVAAIIFGVGIIFAFTYLGSKNFKLIKASKNIQKYLEGVDGIDDDNVSDFTARCFSAKAPQPLRDAWVQYLGVRFGYPSDIVSDKNVYDKIVKKNKDFLPATYLCTSLLLLAICVFWGYGVLDKIYIGTVQLVCLAITGLMFLFLILISRAQTKQCLEAFENMQEDLDAKVNLQVEKNYSTDSSPLAELAGMVEEIIARNTSKAIEIDEEQIPKEPTPIEALIQQEENGTVGTEPAVAPAEPVAASADTVATPAEPAAENTESVSPQEQTNGETPVAAVAENASQETVAQEQPVAQEPVAQTPTEENTAQETVVQDVQPPQQTENGQNEQPSESDNDDEFISDVSLEEVNVEGEQPQTTDDVQESETQADDSDDEIQIQLDEIGGIDENSDSETPVVNDEEVVEEENTESVDNVDESDDLGLSESVEEVESDERSFDEHESDNESGYDESYDENESVDESTDDVDEFDSQNDDEYSDEESRAENTDEEQSAEALDDQTDDDEDESSVDDEFSIERYLGTENSLEQSQNGDVDETVENDSTESQDVDVEYTDSDDTVEQFAETADDEPSIDEQIEPQEEPFDDAEEPVNDNDEEPAEYDESTDEESVESDDEASDDEYADDACDDENDAEEQNEDENTEPEVVYVVDGDEDEEEMVKPAKLVKLPNLVDYMLSKNLPKAMKLQIAGMLISTYKKFENSKQDRQIVVQCLTKVMRDLQK